MYYHSFFVLQFSQSIRSKFLFSERVLELHVIRAQRSTTMASTVSSNPSNLVHAQPSHSILNSINDSANPTPPNPYFLSSSENPGNILVTQPLLGMKNYQSWSRTMILALIAKKKIVLKMVRSQNHIWICLCMKIGRTVIQWCFLG